jgi:hypothetical protein
MQKEILEKIEEMKSLTTAGKIKWQPLNPDAYRWQRALGGIQYIVTLQRHQSQPFGINNPNIAAVYALTIQTTGQVATSLNFNSQSADLLPALQSLYEVVKTAATKTTAEILEQLLSGLG